MATISTYPIAVPKAEDLIVGTQTYTALDNPTRNFTVQSLVSLVTGLVPGGGTVTSVAATGSNGISITGSPITDEGTLTLSLIDGGVPITKLASSAITINGASVSLGGSIAVGGAVTSLATNGTSGEATLISGVLNIPNYTPNPGTVTAVDFTSDIAAFTAAVADGTTTPSISLDINGGTAGQFLRQDGNWAAIPGGNPGTVESVSGTGTVSGLTLTGTVTSSGDLTLGGTLALTSANVTTGLGFTPYNATNPAGYTANTGTTTASNTQIFTNKSGNISQWTNDSGYGTSDLAIGTTSTTALAGNTTIISPAQATAIDDSVKNNTDTYTGTAKITQIVSLSQAQYDAIASPLASTLYIIL